MTEEREALWVEKYRPRTIEDCIIPARVKKDLLEYVEKGSFPSQLYCGTPGTGKTTVAKALCNELGADYIMINGSDESGIATIRNKVKNFASTISIMSDASHKVVIFDEADYLEPKSQGALRGMIEEFHENCRFIFTCNFRNKMIDPIQSRCSVVDFNEFPQKEIDQIKVQFLKRFISILEENEIEYDKKVLAQFINLHFPDFRRMINELQRYSMSGQIDEYILRSASNDAINEIVAFLKNKNFRVMREWVEQNTSLDIHAVIDRLFDALHPLLRNESVPEMILVLDDYQDKVARGVVNMKILMAAMMTTLMMTIEFKE